MDQNQEYEYFTGQESRQFAFIPVPMALLTDARYENLSSDAKLLYALLLNRMNLSRKNGWIDEENRVYIYYAIEDIMADLHCGRNKAVKVLQELDTEKGIGLVEKNRRGQGKGSILYVKDFFIEEQKCMDQTSEETPLEIDEQSVQKFTEQLSEKSDVQKFTKQTSEKNEPVSEVYNSNFLKFTKQTSRSPENKLLEVCNEDSRNNKYINNKYNNNQSNLIISTTEISETGDKSMRYDTIGEYRELIKENIDYDSLMRSYPYDQQMIEGIYQLILETVMAKGEYVLIASNQYPRELVKNKFLKLTFSHIEYVMECLKKNTTRINNIKKYLLAALFNAPSTINSYFQAKVNADFPEYVVTSPASNW